MKVHILDNNHSILNNFLAQIRDKSINLDSSKFRRNLERTGEIIAYEISKSLNYKSETVVTSLGEKEVFVLNENIVLACILRASIPMYQGFLNYFENAESGFIGAYRKEGESDISINLDYVAFPSLEGKTLIVVDPMLATGKSIVKSLSEIKKIGKPDKTILASLISAPEGIEYLKSNLKIDAELYTASVDEKLDVNYYIVPGLGDAGDLSFGEKK